ncbi:probable mannosyltransferase Yur1p [[Candida] railenensis]|uniref:Probable mannosyltransferase Yur1p n=1 Tax=[Candida] railenensis TaxID=45579 RepID=A0A9P0QQJ9_9ASCO|nr:probable mannosyltransferase Yur1p [[Candida] railenensis]
MFSRFTSAIIVLVTVISIYIGRIYKEAISGATPFPWTDSFRGAVEPKMSSNSYTLKKFPQYDRTQVGKENATLIMLARNSDLKGALFSMRSLEDRFNKEYKYPWVFLNEVPFDDDFIEQTSLMASSECFYELIPNEDWFPPDFIDLEKLEDNLAQAEKNKVMYGGSRSYRNMCHFNSGYFFKQKKILEYDWYFRVEPDVEYMCDFQYDPFTKLREQDKVYGFVIALHEYENTIPSLWKTVENFMEKYPQYLHPHNALDFITSKEPLADATLQINSSTDYNMCHFWSNFEIANLNFFRSEAYQAFFDHLDQAGGFYYERWGDAPVHSIALALLADRDSIHHFDDIGYYHPPMLSCPVSAEVKMQKRCICRVYDGHRITDGMDVALHSCLPRWWKYGSGKKFLEN